MPNTVLILGAQGRLGLSAAQAFASAGWRVLGQVRPGKAPAPLPGVEWLAAEVTDAATLVQHVGSVQVVVHALNPPYTNAAWQAQVVPLADAALQVAQRLGATLLVPGNVYNFGTGAPASLQVQTPQQAHTVKGRLRVAMEQRLAASPVQTIAVRAGDFFGQGRGSWWDTVLAKELPKGVLRYPAATGVHTPWAYLPDLAQTFVRVAEKRGQLGGHTTLHFAGHCLCANDWQQALTVPLQTRGWLVAKPVPTLRVLPWWALRLGGWFNPVLASLYDMRYLWARPCALDNAELRALIGEEPHTALAQAVAAALDGLSPGPVVGAVKAVTVAV